MSQSSFWEQDSFFKSYDLVIVGAGIVGLSSAFFYKQEHPDARVAVLERGFLPQGASTRNAGFACVGSVGEHLADMDKESEQNIKKRIKRRYDGLQLLKKTLGEEAIGYEHCGGYEFFRSEEEFEKVAGEIDRFNEWMNELIGEDEVYSSEELQGYPVIRNRLEGALHPGKMMQALGQKVSGLGVDIKWNSKVEKVAEDGAVAIAGGPELRADKVLFAANGFVRRLLPNVDIKPARGLIMVTSEQKNLPWKGIFHHDKGYIYFRNVGGRLLIGGARNLDIEGEETDQFGTNMTIKSHLESFVSEVLKFGTDWKVDYQWSGIMGFTPTKTPIIKQLDERRYLAAGLSGMGIAIGMEVGQGTAKMIT
ncbi:FAD-dependent oxidoreductase [Fodinibius sp. Rm-B-1B1-1]|uniref:NAD(P)/FAD-dependent oxidoreductase n=1 Tax=Fodinibius alkaliphilus TaxID=3140241 RepID=UPI00315A5482